MQNYQHASHVGAITKDCFVIFVLDHNLKIVNNVFKVIILINLHIYAYLVKMVVKFVHLHLLVKHVLKVLINLLMKIAF